MLSRRSLVAAGAVGAGCCAGADRSASNIVRIINPFAAGGTSDAMARLLQPSLQQRLGATIIVENRPGASASIGAAVVAKSPPDGTTWLLTSDTFVVSTLLLNNLPYDVQKDFEPVTMIARGPMVLCAHPSRPFKYAARACRRGQGAARRAHLRHHRHRQQRPPHHGGARASSPTSSSCTCLIAVPRRVLNDGTAGHVDMVISSSATMAPQIESGQLHPVVQFGDKRLSFLPDTATAIEQGLKSLHAYSWFGFFGPAGTPKPVIDGSTATSPRRVREEANYNTFVNKFRSEVVLPPPDELRQMIVEELPFWGKIIRDNNIKSGAG